jgi:hypothetical protein
MAMIDNSTHGELLEQLQSVRARVGEKVGPDLFEEAKRLRVVSFPNK